MRSCSVCRRFNPGAGPHCPRDGAPAHDGPAPELAQGSRVFGRFEIGEPIARGGTGTVYRARDDAQGSIALKVLHAELTQNPVDRSRIKRELTKAASVTHAAIARVREVGETEGRIFLVRDFIEGDSLASVLHRDGPRDVASSARIAHAIASALVEAHKVGVLHRDLNPRHVIVGPAGLPVLLDLALCAPIPGGIAGKPATGSVPYLSPEQAGGKLVTLRADLYGLGLLLHELLTGIGPAADGDAAALIAARAEAEPPPPPEGAPDEIAALLGQLLARDPKDRPFGARQVEKVLCRFATDAAMPLAVETVGGSPVFPGLASRARHGDPDATAPFPTLPSPPRTPLPRARVVAADATAPFPTLPSPPRTPLPPARTMLRTPEPGPDTLPTPGGPRGHVDLTEVDRAAPKLPPTLEEELDKALAVATKGERRDAGVPEPDHLQTDQQVHRRLGDVQGKAPDRRQYLEHVPKATAPKGERAEVASGSAKTRGPRRSPAAEARTRGIRPAEATVSPSTPQSDRAKQSTLVGIALPASPDAPGEERQAWARSLLGLPQEKTPPPPRPDTVPLGAEALFSAEDTAPTAVPVTGFPSEATHRFQPLPSEDEAEEISVRDMEHVTAPTRPSTAVLEAAARALAEPLLPLEQTSPSPPESLEPLDPTGYVAAAPSAQWAVGESELVALPASSRRSKRVPFIVAACVAAVLAGIGVTVVMLGRRGPPPPPSGQPPTPATDPAKMAPVAPASATQAAPTPSVQAPIEAATGPAVPPAVADGGVAVQAATTAPTPGDPVAMDPSVAAPASDPPAADPASAAPTADTDPRTSEQIIKAGRAAIRRKRWTDAGRAFETVLARDPSSLDATLGLAQVQMETRRYEDAIASFRRAIELRPTSATFQLYLGNALSAAGHLDEAKAVWRHVLEMDPRNLEARQRLGLLRRPPPPRPSPATKTRAPQRGAPAPAKTPARQPRRPIPRNPF